MRPRTITLLLVLMMLALPLAAYGYQTAVLDEPVLVAAEEDAPATATTPIRQRLQVHDPDDPIDDPLMTQRRLHATTTSGTPGGNYDQAIHQRTQDCDRAGAMSGTTIRAQQQQRLQMHDPDNPIDDPLMTQQRVRQHAADGTGGHGPGMLGRGEGNNDSCPRDCPND
jgi:hypothetical protein